MSDLKQFSLEEVKKHNTASDCWTVIHNKVSRPSEFNETKMAKVSLLFLGLRCNEILSRTSRWWRNHAWKCRHGCHWRLWRCWVSQICFHSIIYYQISHSSDARELLKDYLIGELVESERTEFKSQYVYTGDNKEGGPTPLFWVIGKYRLRKFWSYLTLGGSDFSHNSHNLFFWYPFSW